MQLSIEDTCYLLTQDGGSKAGKEEDGFSFNNESRGYGLCLHLIFIQRSALDHCTHGNKTTIALTE